MKTVLGLGAALLYSLPAWSAALSGEVSRTPATPRAAPALVTAPAAARIMLPPPATALRKSASLAAETDGATDGAQEIGFAREIAPAEAAAAVTSMQWSTGPAGERVARIAVRSTGAAALRIALAWREAPSEATLRFVSVQDAAALPVPMRDALEATRVAGLYWSPVTAGDEQVVEVVIPAHAANAPLRWSVEALSHLKSDPAAPVSQAKTAGACQVDVACVPGSAAFRNAMRSVAKIVYTVNGITYTCTGTLVNDAQAATQIPYVLTARHCLDTDAAAATVNTFWFLEAAACGSKAAPQATQLTRGARLLYTGALADIALLRLAEPAPAGAWFSGIDAAPMSAGESAIALHHPHGDLKKVSSGRVVNAAEGTSGRLVSMSWLVGATEPGSSGSGLFTERDGQFLLRATLRGGSSSCSSSGRTDDPSNRDYYTRLDADMGAIEALLRAPAAPLEDYSDLWVVPGQDGVGVSITQHASNTTYVVWFGYDAAGTPTWFVMPGGAWSSSSTYKGSLFRARRPGGALSVEPVGEATLTFHERSRATMSYTLDGAPGSLPLERQVF